MLFEPRKRGGLLSWLVLIAGVGGCASVPCEERGTCPDESAFEAGLPTLPMHDAELSDTGLSEPVPSDASGVVFPPGDAQTVPPASDASLTTDAGTSGESVDGSGANNDECQVDAQCPAQEPVCLTTLDSSPKRCVQCVEHGDCSSSAPVCIANACTVCDVNTHEGCTGATPVCERDGNDTRCVVCSPEDSTGCSPATPICVEDGETARCIQCGQDDHCPEQAPVCLGEECVVCDLATHAGCEQPAPFCTLRKQGARGVEGGTLSEASGDGGSLIASQPEGTGSQDATFSSNVRLCVECRADEECGGATPACIDGVCVECASDENCTDPAASRCDTTTNTCAPCSEAGQCQHLGGTPACDTTRGQCVECTAEEHDSCGDRACHTLPDALQFTCSQQLAGNAETCEPCVSDAACGTGLGCVGETFAGADTGWYCLPRAEPEPDCTLRRPFIGITREASVDGEAGPYCRPRHTTCAGYLNYGRGAPGVDDDTCSSDDECGLPGVDDGYCVALGSVSMCTYECGQAIDCLLNRDCGTVPETVADARTVCTF